MGNYNNKAKYSRRWGYFTLLSIVTLCFIGCTSWLPDAHRVDVTQGNAIERTTLNKIQPGMKKAEVKTILGTPLIADPFHDERWDYIYRYIPGDGTVTQSRVTLIFEGDVLVSIDDSEYREPIKTMTEEQQPVDDSDNPENIGPKPEIIDRPL